MPRVIFVTAAGEQSVSYAPGDVLMVLAVRNMIEGIEAQCGGSRACGTCVVKIAEPWRDRLPAMADEERELLDWVEQTAPDARLSCQIVMTGELDGLRAVVPQL